MKPCKKYNEPIRYLQCLSDTAFMGLASVMVAKAWIELLCPNKACILMPALVWRNGEQGKSERQSLMEGRSKLNSLDLKWNLYFGAFAEPEHRWYICANKSLKRSTGRELFASAKVEQVIFFRFQQYRLFQQLQGGAGYYAWSFWRQAEWRLWQWTVPWSQIFAMNVRFCATVWISIGSPSA